MGKTKNRVYLRSRSRSKVLSSELDLDLSLKKIEIMMLSYVCGIYGLGRSAQCTASHKTKKFRLRLS